MPLVKAMKDSVVAIEKVNELKKKQSANLERKRANYAPKREKKIQLKLHEAIDLDLQDKKVLAEISLNALREGRVTQESSKIISKDGQLGPEGKECQRQAQ